MTVYTIQCLQAVGLIKEEAYKHAMTELALDTPFGWASKRNKEDQAKLERRQQAKL